MTSEKHDRLIQQVLMKIGHNLLEFQRIEGCLKIISPYLVTPTDACQERPFLEISALLSNKQTLGVLIGHFKEANQSEDRTNLEQYFHDMLTHRNDLVHHFLERLDAQLDTEEKCRSAIAYLDKQHQFIRPMVELMQGFVTEFASAMAEAAGKE